MDNFYLESQNTHNVLTCRLDMVTLVTAAMKLKDGLLLGRKAIANLGSVLKSRDINLPTKGLIITAMVFPVVMHECESWITKKIEHQRTDAFELWC